MPLRLQIISRQRQALGERSVKQFGRNGGTIGRSLECDWVLPDAQRYVSSRHASIDFRSGSYYIVDTSTNGVYVNDSEQPVGRGKPQRLFGGDRIRLGDYEIAVEIDEPENVDLSGSRHVDPVARAQRVPPPDPTRGDLVQAHEITGVGIEVLLDEEAQDADVQHAAQLAASTLRLDDEPKSAPAPKHEPAPVSAAARLAASLAERDPAATGARGAKSASPAAASPATAPMPSGVLDAFFRGAGLPAHRLDEKQIEQTLHRLGQLMRELALGLYENLHVRTEQKTALHLPTTAIQPQHNNPLKFSASVDESLGNLLFRQSSEYMQAVEAVREAFGDIKRHQQALLGALRTTIADYIARLDPDALESKVANGKRGGLMSTAHKLKYWDLYKDLYQLVTQCEAGQLPQQFLEDLSRAYEQEDARAGSARKPQPKAQ
jgi:type VI secretion system FHA domain protein